MLAFRIADRRHSIFDPTGAFLNGGRWNSVGKRVIYAAQTYAGALLEVLVHANLGVVPKTQAVVEISIPENVSIETIAGDELEGWAADDLIVSRRFGDIVAVDDVSLTIERGTAQRRGTQGRQTAAVSPGIRRWIERPDG